MSSTTLTPASDLLTSGVGWAGATGANPPYYPLLKDGSNTTYWDDGTGGGSNVTLRFGLSALPGDFGTATACSIKLRCSTSSNDGSRFLVRCYQSDGSTPTTVQGTITPTSFGTPTFADVSTTVTLSQTSAAAWTSAQIWITDDDNGGAGTGDWFVAEVSVTLTYTASGGGGGGGAGGAGMLIYPGAGNSGGSSSLGGTTRTKSRIEGYRFIYNQQKGPRSKVQGPKSKGPGSRPLYLFRPWTLDFGPWTTQRASAV